MKYEIGKRLMSENQHQDALRVLKESLDLQTGPNTRLLIARCHLALGHIGSAYAQYRQVAVEAHDRVTAGDRRMAATRDAARDESAALELRVPHLTLALPADIPERFVVKLDGDDVPRSTWGTALIVDPGLHKIVATGPRFHPFEREVLLKEGELQRLDLRPQHRPTAVLRLRFTPHPEGLAVSIDGRQIPPELFTQSQDMEVGAHEVIAQAPGYQTFRWRGDLPDSEVSLKVPMRPAPATSRAAFFAVSGTAVVVLAAGTGLLVSAENTQADELAKPQPQRDPAVRDSVHGMGIAAIPVLVAGGALAVAACALAFTTRWQDIREARGGRGYISFTPWLTPTTGGVTLAGRFGR